MKHEVHRPVSSAVAERLKEKGIKFYARSNIAEHITEEEKAEIQIEVEEAMEDVLRALVIDTHNDDNSRETAKRVAKMFVREVFAGRYDPKPSVTDFNNEGKLDELYVVGPVSVTSYCSHHLVPIIGKVWVGVQPKGDGTDKVIGLSKFHRIANWIMSRPSIQEEATLSLADELESTIHPTGLGVIYKAKHFCVVCRGVKDSATVMTSCVVRGSLRESPGLKTEFLELVKMSES